MEESQELTDKTLVCVGCKEQFTFSASEQGFFKERKLEHPPKRCFQCRKERREKRGSRPVVSQNDVYPITCSDCGKADTVPFKPHGDKPVYCRPCLHRRRTRVAEKV